MATPSQTPDKSNRAVIAFADGRRMRGYIFDFSAIKDSLKILFGSRRKKTRSRKKGRR